jgi:hypothetical protein
VRNLRLLDKYRVKHSFGNELSADEGAFQIGLLRVLACAGDGWDHVSVSLENRIPTWEEMEYIKRMFFKDDETAMQLHMPPSNHINCHPNVLHIWRPHNIPIPRPPISMV